MSLKVSAFCWLLFLPFPSKAAARPLPESGEYGRHLLSREDFAAKAPPTLTAAQASADLVRLEELMKEAYAGYEYFGGLGTDWSGLFGGLKKELSSGRDWSAAAYFELLLGHLRTAGIRDNHLSLRMDGSEKRFWAAPYSSHWTPRFADYYVTRKDGKFYFAGRDRELKRSVELLMVEGRPPREHLFPTYAKNFPDELYLPGILAETPADRLNCTVRIGTAPARDIPIPLHPVRVRPRTAKAVFESGVLEGVPYIALRSMRNEDAEDLSRFVRSAVELRESPVLILDLRGTAGGSDGWGNRWLAGLSNETFRPDRTVKVLVSPATLQGQVNYLRESLFQPPTRAGREHISAALARAERELAAAAGAGIKRHWEPRVFEWTGAAPERFRGSILVLSDARNASAGESFVETLRGLGGRVVVMGENSMGVNSFGPLYTYQLPNSRIRVYLAQGITLFGGNALYEAKGVPPDIWIDEEDILPAALEYAKRLRGGPAGPIGGKRGTP